MATYLVATHEWVAWAAARSGDATGAAVLLTKRRARAHRSAAFVGGRADSELRQAQTLQALGRGSDATQLAQWHWSG